MTRYSPLSIERRGLQSYLNATKDRHGGNGYDLFVTLLDTASQTKLAMKFNVRRQTVRRWLAIYAKEQAKDKVSAKGG